ncbi:Multifunctional tryptophan biosynthesis protein [Choanephora cucurbitarum]|uniref:Multifunctional tryptophan biosynthesis protein n=1 Tax=Choanephora cucurbitarum TaxID=101091 RepID=A0A1C7NF46_9FUNG|nr:Multifunctional tryptophan biosynthesis protein [Choanephora cucurbitarum]
MTTLLIDNYDSFTYNVYQYLCSQGADVVVYRNDKITIEEIEKLAPRNIVISPGPGHPAHDAGISRAAIDSFAGKIPILGICMGLQCMFEVYGGTVSYAGDIMHGKASTIKHDSRGVFKGVPQNNQVTRYHSLAGMPSTIPDSLEVTATTDDGVIMGVRHKEYTVEGVQFHPESILCENGHTMIQNFLKLEGGTWEGNPGSGVLPKKLRPTAPAATATEPTQEANTGAPSILTRIYAQRVKDVQAAKEIAGQTMEDLEKLLQLHVAPPLQDVVARIRHQTPALLAEVKRASPSKGNIDVTANAAKQALDYAMAGASVVSVLTEPKWFKGTIHDMRQVREAISHLPNRPCVLRKDFIVDRYQILEGRIYGCDTVLLIVAMLSDDVLHDLYNYSKSLGMEPLVEVNNAEEMSRANALGAKLIGVNNRNLHSFDVDMETTSRLAEMVPEGTVLCALSGITGRADVEMYVKQGVRGVLVGEALMRAWNLKEFVADLLGQEKKDPAPASNEPKRSLVKICGISSVEAAKEAALSGADLIGLIFAERSKRTVPLETAKQIVQAVRELDIETDRKPTQNHTSLEWFQTHRRLLENRTKKPLVVGVFVNQSVDYMAQVALEVGLDLVQLHGTESVELARYLPVPVIKAFHIDSASFKTSHIPNITQPGSHHYVLLDAKVSSLPSDQQGGKGVKFDWSIAREIIQHKPLHSSEQQHDFPVILAGGLDPTNVAAAITQVKPWIVDVSSGVETDGVKDLSKIRAFVEAVKNTHH